MLLVVLVISIVATVSGQGRRCCMPSKWSGYMSDPRIIAGGDNMSSQFNYDYDNKAIAIQFFKFGGIKTEDLIRVVTRYGEGKRFTIKADGSCTSRDLVGEDLIPNCIPAGATYLGSNYFGPDQNRLNFDAWNVPLGQLNLTLLISQPDCILLAEGVKGSVTSGSVDTTYIFNGVLPGIPDQSVFFVPPGC